MSTILASRKINLAMAVIVVVAAMSLNASAESLLASTTRTGNYNQFTTHVFVALNDAGATALSFTTTANNKVVKITYNAECGVTGPVGSWQSVTILVDGVQASPASGTGFAFCTSTGSVITWVGSVRQSLIKVPVKGTHNVQVLVDLLSGATGWWLGDTSIVVEQQ